MRRLFVVLAVFSSVAVAADAPPIREVTSLAARASGFLVPAFYKGYIYWAGNEPLRIYAPDGHQVYIQAPQGTVESIAADSDGALAVAWHTLTAGFIDLHDASGALVRTISTGRYRASHLAFADDRSLWSLGWQMLADKPWMWERSDYMIVRKFLPDGQQAGAYLPNSLFPQGMPPGEQRWQRSNCITVSHDTIGLWVQSGMDSGKTEWVELDLNGKLTGRWRLDSFFNELQVAFTADDHVFIHHRDRDGTNPRLLTLDRATSTWQPVPWASSDYLVSADGDALIFSDYSLGPIHLRWYPHP